MTKYREPKDGLRRDRLGIGNVVAQVRRAIELNQARESATADALTELLPGDLPEDWPFSDLTSDLIRDPLRRAEALLHEQVAVIDDGDNTIRLEVPEEVAAGLNELDRAAVQNMMIERTLQRLNASWSYIDIVDWAPLVRVDETPVLYLLLRLPLGKPHKGHKLLGEEHNLSGIHFHYARLDGQRSDILFAFGQNPPEPNFPVKWERHGTNKAKFRPRPENWNFAKRENINTVCCAARANLAADTRFFTPSKESQFLLPM